MYEIDFMTAALNDIAHSLVADGTIDDNEIRQLKDRILDDGAIDEEEAEFLFTVNDIVKASEENSKEYEEFFIEAITAFVLQDVISPGVLDKYEFDWLKGMIGDDDDMDVLEQRLLINIASEAISVPVEFEEFIQSFEEIEYEDQEDEGSGFFYARIARSIKDKIRG